MGGTCVVVVEQQATVADRVFSCLPVIQQKKTSERNCFSACSLLKYEDRTWPIPSVHSHRACYDAFWDLHSVSIYGHYSVSSFGRRALQASKTLGRQALMYHSELTVSFSWSGTEAT